MIGAMNTEKSGKWRRETEVRSQNPEPAPDTFYHGWTGINTDRKRWEMQRSGGVGGWFWRKTVVLNYTYLHAFTRKNTTLFSLTLWATNSVKVGKFCLFGYCEIARLTCGVPPFAAFCRLLSLSVAFSGGGAEFAIENHFNKEQTQTNL